MQEKTIELRAISPLNETILYTVQGDTGRTLKCRITDMVIPDGAGAVFWARKPSGSGIQNISEVSGQYIIVTLTNQVLAEVGKIACQIQISTQSQSIKTYRFTIINEESLAGDWPESENQSTWLEAELQKMQDALDAYVEEKDGEINDFIAGKTEEFETIKEAASEAADYAKEQGDFASQKAQEADMAANTAEEAADTANAVADDLIKRRDAGEFTGPQGPQGIPGQDGKDGANGVVVTIAGQFAMQIQDGHLYVIYPDGGTAPDMEINNDTGHLLWNY